MSLTLVHTALKAQAKAAWGSAVLEHENAPVVKPTNAKWVKYRFKPNAPSVWTLGATGLDKVDGVFDMSVDYPLNTGGAAAETDYEALRVKFNATVKLTSGGQVVIIKNVGRSEGFEVDHMFRVVFTVYWEARIARSG